MIITELKPLAEIINSLKGHTKVFLVGCGECATTCKTGGKEEIEKVGQQLRDAGFLITGSCIPGAPCIAAQIKVELAKNMRAFREAEALVVCACGLGVQSVKDNDRFAKKVLPGCNTLFGAVCDAQGAFIEKCSMCGECVLGMTAGICPITLCPKGLLNGPCGGMDKGKCEVNKDEECAWVLIYREQEKRGTIAAMKSAQPPRDFKKGTKPHRVAVAKA